MSRRRLVLLATPALLLAACSGTPEPTEPATSIPTAWLEITAEGWPGSSGHNSSAPVLSGDRCLLTETLSVRGETARTDMSGWGPYGDDSTAADAYRYVCDFRGDAMSAQLQIIQAGSPEDARYTVESFLDQPTNDDQENEATTVRVGESEVHVNMRTYPGSGSTRASAVFHDEQTDALAYLEVRPRDDAGHEDYPPQQVAEDLMLQLARVDS